jgi:hypothetical protein
MSFEHDVFISYPHLSNRDDDLGHNGWVAKFHRRLKDRLTDLLGREVRIWRDNKLQAGAVFGKEIRDRLRKSKVLLCVLSPGYIKSKWCIDELQEFHRLAQENGHLSVEGGARIIAVVKIPLLKEQRFPDELEGSIYKEFYKKTEDSGDMPRILGQEQGEYGYEEYKLKVEEVAWAIKNMVESLGDDGESDVERTIYLAETTRDRAVDRKRIKDELEARKFIVVPKEPLPVDIQEFETAVRENLQRSFISIHLMGRAYGTILEDAEGKSVVHLQNEWAAEHSAQDARFKRIIWIPPDLENTDATQTQFLDELRKSEKAQQGAELYDKRQFQDLTSRIIQLIIKSAPKPPPDNLIRIYLMCDRPDVESVNPVWRYLFNRGFEVIPPAEDDEEGQIIQYHKENLLICDATLIVYGKTKWNWVQFRLNDVSERVRGWGREKDIPCKAILRTDPETEYKVSLNTRIAKLLTPCYNGLSDQALEVSLNEFITDLEQQLSA